MSRLYVSGPVTGIYNNNREAFEDASLALDRAGYAAFTPHDTVPAGTPWPMAMLLSINDLTTAGLDLENPYYDGVALLEGWEQSEGARLEKAVAEVCGIPCKTVDEWLEEAR